MKKIILLIFCISMLMSNISHASLADMVPATHRDSNNEIVLGSNSHCQSKFIDKGLIVCENDIVTPYNPARSHKFIVYRLAFDHLYSLHKEFFILPMLAEIPANTDPDQRIKVAFPDPQSTGIPADKLPFIKLTEFTTKDLKFLPLKPIEEIKLASDLKSDVLQAVKYIQNKNKPQ